MKHSDHGEPGHIAKRIVDRCLTLGSRKDGSGRQWAQKMAIFHLVKGMSHLAIHIKQIYDVRALDGENHLHKAMTRLAMAAAIEERKKDSGGK